MENKPLYDLIAMGRCGIDLYSNDIGTPFIDIKSFAAYVGGSSTNIAVGAQRLGLRTALLTAVGPDLVGDFVLHFLNQEGVETSYIPRKPGARTGAVLLGIEPPYRFPLEFYRDNAADSQISIGDVNRTPIHRCRVFEFGGNNLNAEPSRSATLYALERARAAGVTVAMDIDFRIDQWYDSRAFGLAVRPVIPMTDIVIGTEEEFKIAMLADHVEVHVDYSQVSAPEVTGDLDSAVQLVMDRGPKVAVVKRGARGCTIYQPGIERLEIPSFQVEVLNILGAGDAFASGFLYGWLQGWNLSRAGQFGNACGAILVTRHACANDMPRLAEVINFMEANTET
jgi:5-dehydro-2-deoxygluconokinase